MKVKLIIIAALLSSVAAFSQSQRNESRVVQKPNRIGINFGFGVPITSGSGTIKTKASANTFIDYGRAITEKIELGVEYNQSLSAVKDSEASVDVLTAGASRAFLGKIRYYITGNTFKGFYTGLGLGFGKTGYAMKISGTVYSGATNNNFAFAPELGYRYKWFNASVKFLSIGGKKTDDLGNGVTSTINLDRYQDLQFAVGANIPF